MSKLSQSNCLSMMLNGTNVNPNGRGSGTPILDNTCNADNSTIRMPLANARAVGLAAAHDCAIDGSASFSSAFTWDFDPTNGVNSGAFDERRYYWRCLR